MSREVAGERVTRNFCADSLQDQQAEFEREKSEVMLELHLKQKPELLMVWRSLLSFRAMRQVRARRLICLADEFVSEIYGFWVN